MRTVFEPSNALEGHMLQDLLRQRGISSRVDGAQLQGGVGEIPVTGFVRLVVEDEDYQSARVVIEEWESTVVPDPIPIPPNRPANGLRGALLGLALGIAGSYFFFRAPLSVEGIDFNEDGVLDERWIYSTGGTMVRSTLDRNFDGEVDFVNKFDRHGYIASAEGDDDFDGTFEWRTQYHEGNAEITDTDTNNDSSVDLRSNFKYGVLVSEEHFVPSSDLPVRIERFHLGRLTTAEVDTDRDGRLDMRYRYSDTAEVIGTEEIGTPN